MDENQSTSKRLGDVLNLETARDLRLRLPGAPQPNTSSEVMIQQPQGKAPWALGLLENGQIVNLDFDPDQQVQVYPGESAQRQAVRLKLLDDRDVEVSFEPS